MQIKHDVLPLTDFGGDWCLGEKPKGLFDETGYRMTFSRKKTHLYPTDQKPDTQGLEHISYESWHFQTGKGSGQLYLE